MNRKTRKLLKRSGNQYDTIRLMKQIAHKPDPYILDLALDMLDKFPGNRVKQLHGAFEDVFSKTRFIKDPDQVQQIRTPNRLIREGVGNCVDYATFLASMCMALRIPCTFKMVSFGPDQNFSHIYTVTSTSPRIYLDPVLGQDQNGQEATKPADSRKYYFNREAPHTSSYELDL